MCFSAVYLDHHWVLDAIAGTTYCAIIVVGARAFTRSRARARTRARSPSRWPGSTYDS
jgi:membrane-associated phospholipid phosphatase